MALEKLKNGQGVVITTDTTKQANGVLKAQGWTTTSDASVQPVNGDVGI